MLARGPDGSTKEGESAAAATMGAVEEGVGCWTAMSRSELGEEVKEEEWWCRKEREDRRRKVRGGRARLTLRGALAYVVVRIQTSFTLY